MQRAKEELFMTAYTYAGQEVNVDRKHHSTNTTYILARSYLGMNKVIKEGSVHSRPTVSFRNFPGTWNKWEASPLKGRISENNTPSLTRSKKTLSVEQTLSIERSRSNGCSLTRSKKILSVEQTLSIKRSLSNGCSFSSSQVQNADEITVPPIELDKL